MRRPIAWLISIGNELLVGRIVNTNASWIAAQLTLMGVNVKRIVTVGDSIDEIVDVVRDAIAWSDIVVTTGGLGPTDDDITMEAIAAALHRPLELNPQALRMVKEFYSRKGYKLTKERVKMAFLPAGANPIPNPEGAAPGAHITEGHVEVFILPGVPREMQAMFSTYVVNAIKYMLPPLCVKEASIIVEGIPEADLAPLLRRASKECMDCYTKSHPKGHEVDRPLIEVRVLSSAETCEEALAKAMKVINSLKNILSGINHVVVR